VSIHPLAVVSPDARLGVGVTIGAFATVEAGVELGDFCNVASGAHIKSGVSAGCHNEFCEHAVIGGAPQHAARPQQIGRVVIGDHNVFREYVTIHRALKPEVATTWSSATIASSPTPPCSVATSSSKTGRSFPEPWPCTSSAASAVWP
jgi:acyl-[acyl carrier protein]--UDP-N-acetylglucosamine O-acyltransferase